MKVPFWILIFMLFACAANAQVTERDSIAMDSIMFNTQLQEVIITNVKDTLSDETKKQLMLLKRRVLKVYPYAKIGADKLTMLNTNIARLKSEKDKKKYSKMLENYLQDEFEGQLKKLSRKEGRILVKLIYRQTGHTTFDLIKEHKSGWKAFWSSRIAKAFDIDLKSTYNPQAVAEDFMIEGFLLQAFDEHRLVRQDPAFTIDYPALKKGWKLKAKKTVAN